MARLTGLPVSTTHRMVNELAGRNLLVRRADSLYEVGSALRGLGDGAWSFSALQQQGSHLLTDLSEATGRRTRLGVLVEGRVVYMEKRFGPDPATTFPRAAMLPAHATALGKALLAFTPPASVAQIVGPLTTFTPQTLDTLDRLHHALHVIRVRKLAMSLGEHFAGECTIAAPVFAPDGTVAAAVEVEVAHARRDFQLCRAPLMAGAGALTRELASTTPDAFPQLEIVPGSIGSGRASLEPIRPGRRRLRQTLVREVDIRGAQEA
jgi:DNA-binding IclR family transcriptional regulator